MLKEYKIREIVRQCLYEAEIGHDWKQGKNGLLSNPDNYTTDSTSKDQSYKNREVGYEYSEKQGKNGTKTYRKKRDAIPHKESKTKGKVFMRGYKQFRYNPNSKGVVFPLYINTEFDRSHKNGLKVGKWYGAGQGECWTRLDNQREYVSSNLGFLANRPGWHLIDTPWGNQRGTKGKKNKDKGEFQFTNNDEVWAECDIIADVDYNNIASMEKDGYLQYIPKNGFYYYKTNQNGSNDVNWIIADKIRINRILSDDSVDNLNNSYFQNKPQRNEKGKLTYYKMPRKNGNRVSDEDIKKMGF